MSRRDHQQQGGSKITLPITPMLDMTFQLLFFFMLNFNPMPAEGAVDMALPSGPGVAEPQVRPVAPVEPRFDADLTVKVRARADGEIVAISVSSLEGNEDAIEGRDLLLGLRDYLARARKRAGAGDTLRLQGDGELKVGQAIEVLDVCRKAGFTDIRFATPQ